MEKAHRQYILTQGPLPNTTPHFWLMVWEQNCKAVLMLNRIVEKDQVKFCFVVVFFILKCVVFQMNIIIYILKMS